jgi:hypothetical protein
VNDHICDGARQSLVELVPDVIGLTGSDLHTDLRIALRAATTTLPVVAEERQGVMAVAILTCERLLAELDGRPGTSLSRRSRDALAMVPRTAAWAQRYGRHVTTSRRVFRRQTVPAIVGYAVQGIALASVPDPDRLLRDLLVGAIEDCRARPGSAREPAAEPVPAGRA